MFHKLRLLIAFPFVLLLASAALRQAQDIAYAQGPVVQHTDPFWQASYWNNMTLSGNPVVQVASFGPDLIVLDILMPRVDGREVLRRLRQAGNWTPVILLTQVGESTERAMALIGSEEPHLTPKVGKAYELGIGWVAELLYGVRP